MDTALQQKLLQLLQNYKSIEIPKGKKKYYGQCNQICGVNHAYMPIVIQALPKDEYKEWLKEAKVKFAKNTLEKINKYALLEKKEVKEIK